MAGGTVASWGSNDYGQCDAPVTLGTIVQVAAGGAHTVALGADGTVVCWGNNMVGQCTVPTTLGTVVQVAAGSAHTVALGADGIVACWGSNQHGQCNVPPLLSRVLYIAAGQHNSFAITNLTDCNLNGLEDSEEIAMTPQLDCDGDGALDYCQLHVLVQSPVQAPFGYGPVNYGAPLNATFSELAPAIGPVSLTVAVASDLNGPTEFVVVKLNGEVVGVLFGLGGTDCPTTPDIATIMIPATQFNEAIASSPLKLAVEASGAVNPDQCAVSTAQVTLDYPVAFADWDGNGVWDPCDIANGTVSDCNGNGMPDICEPGLDDCNSNGVPDLCEIQSGSAADENADGIPDECSYSIGDFDLDGHITGVDLAFLLGAWGSHEPVIDLNGDGVVAGADLAILLGHWG